MSLETLRLRRWRLASIAAGALFVVLALRPLTGPGAQSLGGGAVHGVVQLAFGLSQASGTAPIVLPDITVYLQDVATGAQSSQVTTNLYGVFQIPTQPAGTYEVCLTAPGFASSCPRRVSIEGEVVYLPPLALSPGGNAVVGTVMRGQGGPCNFDDQVLGVQFATVVRVEDGGGADLVPPVRANSAGEYVQPAVPAGTSHLVAGCEAAGANQSISVSGGGPLEVDLTLDNPPGPSISSLVATQNGQAVRQAAPGSTVQVAVQAVGAASLHYAWEVSNSLGGFSPVDANTVSWTLPGDPGTQSVYVLVHDGRGGVAQQRLDLSTDAQGVVFSGTVSATDQPVVAGATVSVNGASTQTDAGGNFSLSVASAERYVLNIQQTGYQLLSKVFSAAVRGQAYQLVRAQQFVFDAQQGATLIESSGPNGPGARVTIPPGALVDAGGRSATGPVYAYISSIALRDLADRFPGEYGGNDGSGQVAGLNSLGAVDVQLTDALGHALNLRSGSTATVSIPMDPMQLGMPQMPPGPPPTVPIWFYNRTSGVWDQGGQASFSPPYYVTQVPHFSTINADIAFNNPACMRVVSDLDRLPLPYRLRISVPAANPAKVITRTVADRLSVIYLLPANTAVRLEVLDSAGRVIPLATTVRNTGASSNPALPPYPYASCTSEARLTFSEPTSGALLAIQGLNNAGDADKYYEKIDGGAVNAAGTVSSAGTAVTGAGTSFTTYNPGHLIRAANQVRLIALINSDTSITTETAFNPALPAKTTFEIVGDKPTLADWKRLNGFGGGEDNQAVYFNGGDLGLGRWMHMKKSGNNIAYYVSNYGIPPDRGSVDLASFARQRNDPSLGLIATVAMEYSPDAGGKQQYTKFYVFNNAGNRGGNRVNKADLDGNGNKYIPNLCVICHGQNTFSKTDASADLSAHFIPFDLDSFRYSTLANADSRANQEPQFKGLNAGVHDVTRPTPAITELIEGWYGGARLPNAAEDDNFVVTGWTAPVDKSSLYTQVVKPSCRSCHITREGTISWAKWSDAANNAFKESGGDIRRLVCGPNRLMPHAKVTYQNFWRSTNPHQPAALANGGLDGFPAHAPCPCRRANDNTAANAGLPVCP